MKNTAKQRKEEGESMSVTTAGFRDNNATVSHQHRE
jgi:hypothetical protein